MQKIKLLIADSNLVKPWLAPLWQEFFDIEMYDPGTVYPPGSIVVADNRFGEAERYKTIRQHDYQIILPYLNDSDVNDVCRVVNGEFELHARDWIWIQESSQYRWLNYHEPRPPATPDRFFLLLMNLKRANRDQLYAMVDCYLDRCLYSYVERGITLPGDVYVPHPYHGATANDRFYVPDWYAQTCFSLVSESFIKPKLFISEKIFKPLAYQHPLVVFGTPRSLEYIRSLGFETFGHVIDEKYDTVPNDTPMLAHTRLSHVMMVLEKLHSEFIQTGQVFQDATTKQILAHNHALFFDRTRVRDMFEQQIVRPIQEFVESL